LQIETTYDPSTDKLTSTTVSISIPGYGLAVAFQSGPSVIDLKNPKSVPIIIPNASLEGTFKFSYDNDKDRNIQLYWNVLLPWLGTYVTDTQPLFPHMYVFRECIPHNKLTNYFY
jgi:hypothetical protein